MSKRRKTASIAQMLYDVNQKNLLSTCSAEVRQGWNSMISTILMAADVYAGFGYIEDENLPEGVQPGIYFCNAMGVPLSAREYFDRLGQDNAARKRGLPTRYHGDQKTFPDESRRTFYVHGHIAAEYRAIADAAESVRLPLSAEQKGIDRAA